MPFRQTAFCRLDCGWSKNNRIQVKSFQYSRSCRNHPKHERNRDWRCGNHRMQLEREDPAIRIESCERQTLQTPPGFSAKVGCSRMDWGRLRFECTGSGTGIIGCCHEAGKGCLRKGDSHFSRFIKNI